MSSNRVTIGAPLPAGTNNIGDVDLASVPAPLSTAGGGTEAAALRVTLASDSTGVVSVDDNGSTLSVDDGGGSLTVDGSVAVSNFPATQPVSGTVAISNPTTNPETGLAKDVSLGGLTETAPASDTASSALNGRLQRIAQRLTSLIALFPTKSEDAASASGDLGFPMLGVRNDGQAVTTTTDGDYGIISLDDRGRVRVAVDAAPAVTGTVTANAGTNLNTSALALETTQTTQNTAIGGLTETAPASDTASSGLNGRLQRIAQRLTSLIALLPAALGAGGGIKVDGSGTALPVSGTVTANAGTNLNTSALALDATQATTNTEIGGLTETAPATDTASSGLNGRLQRIAQRLTSLIAVFNIGAGTEAAAVRVTLPTDGTGKVNAAQSGTWTVQPGNTANTTAWKVDGSAVTQPVSQSNAATTSTLTNVSASASNVTVLASNANRLMAMIFNDSTSIAYFKCGATASATSFTIKVAAGGYMELPLTKNGGVYTGIIDGIWVAANGSARVTELTA